MSLLSTCWGFFFFVLPNNCHCHRSLISFFSEYLCCHRCWYWHQLEKLPSRSGKSLEVWGVQYLACNAIPLLEECLFMRTRKSCSCVTLLLEHQVQLLIKRKMAVSQPFHFYGITRQIGIPNCLLGLIKCYLKFRINS